MVSTVLVGPDVATASGRPAADRPPAQLALAANPPATPVSAIPDRKPPAAKPSACGGKLAFGRIVVCPSISGDQPHVYTITTTRNADQLFTQLTRGSGDLPGGAVTTPDGELVCGIPTFTTTCQLGAAGTYKITVSLHFGEKGDYTLAVESMRTPSSCTSLPNSFFSFASPGRTATLPTGAAAACYRFNQPVGSVLHLVPTGGSGDVRGDIFDAQFQPVCHVRDTGQCTLSQPGPYRLFLNEFFGDETTYTLRLPRISRSTGCPRLKVGPFGDPGSSVGAGTLVKKGDVTCHKLRPATAGRIAVRISPDQDLWWTVYDDAGQALCDKYSGRESCDLPAAGAYSLVVLNQNDFGRVINYQAAVYALVGDAGCAATTGTSWDLPALLVHQTSAVQVSCQPFQGNAGDRIVTYAAPTAYNFAVAWLADSTGATVCVVQQGEEDGCVLPATGTYRVISYLSSWDDEADDLTYRLQVRRLSAPAGCPTVTPGAYGAPPAGAPGGIRCRIIDIPAAGYYLVRAVSAQNYETYGQVYDNAGLRTDFCGTLYCNFAAPGRYTVVLKGSEPGTVIDNDFHYSLVLLSVAPSGCDQVTDTGLQSAPHRGEFLAAGQYDCLQLPSPAGSRIIELVPGDATGAGRPSAIVVDATGAYVCDSSWALRQSPCELTGTAPFFALLSTGGGDPTGGYAIAFARMDGPPDCPVLPRDAEGTAVTGADRFAVCFAIPADQHAARETFTYRRTSGSGDASLWIFNGAGLRYCGPLAPATERTFTCPLPEGPATVVLETDAVDAAYVLTHRDGSTPAR